MPATPKPPFHRWGVRFTSDNTHNKAYLQSLLDNDSESMYRGELFINEPLDHLYYADSTGVVRRLGERSIPTLSPATSNTLGGVKVGTGINVTPDGTISASATNANTGDVTFTDNYIVGTGTIGGGWGLFFAPGPDFIDPDNATTNGTQYVRLRAGDDESHIHFDTADDSLYDWYFGNDSKYVMLSKDGAVRIQASGIAGTGKWVFNDTGTLKLAGGSTADKTGPGTYLSSNGTVYRSSGETSVTVFTASQTWMTTVKLLIQAESFVEETGWDTQATELLIVKSFNGPSVNSYVVSEITTGGVDNDIYISNYSVSLVDGKITVTAEPIDINLTTGASTTVAYSVSVIEMYTND